MQMPHAAGLAAALAASLLACRSVSAQDVKAGDLVIEKPWTRATPGGAQVAGGYLSVLNRGTTPDRLTGGSFEAADRFEMHDMTTENGVMKMRPVGPLDIPPGGTLTLSPGGRHIMFTGLKHGLKTGESVAGTLTFEHAGTVPVRFTVEGIGAKAPSGTAGPPKHLMPGMDMN